MTNKELANNLSWDKTPGQVQKPLEQSNKTTERNETFLTNMYLIHVYVI